MRGFRAFVLQVVVEVGLRVEFSAGGDLRRGGLFVAVVQVCQDCGQLGAELCLEVRFLVFEVGHLLILGVDFEVAAQFGALAGV